MEHINKHACTLTQKHSAGMWNTGLLKIVGWTVRLMLRLMCLILPDVRLRAIIRVRCNSLILSPVAGIRQGGTICTHQELELPLKHVQLHRLGFYIGHPKQVSPTPAWRTPTAKPVMT